MQLSIFIKMEKWDSCASNSKITNTTVPLYIPKDLLNLA